MSNMDQTDANNLLAASLGLQTYPVATGPAMMRLMATAGTASTNGTPVTGGSYAPQSLTAACPAMPTAGSGITNSVAAITYSNMPATTTNAVEVWDSASTAKRHWQGTITSKTTNAGDTLTFAVNSVTITLG